MTARLAQEVQMDEPRKGRSMLELVVAIWAGLMVVGGLAYLAILALGG